MHKRKARVARGVEVAIDGEMALAEAPKGEVAVGSETGLKAKDRAAKRIAGLEDRLLEQSMRVVTEAMQFADVAFGEKTPPEEWVETMGSELAERKLRYVLSGQMSGKDAPVGVKVAQAVAIGILKTRASRTQSPSLNISYVELTKTEVRVYPVQRRDG